MDQHAANAAGGPLRTSVPTATSLHPGEFLLEALRSIDHTTDVAELAARVQTILKQLPQYVCGGVGVYDLERQLLLAYFAPAGGGPGASAGVLSGDPLASSATEIPHFLSGGECIVSENLSSAEACESAQWIRDLGARGYVCVPLGLARRLVGALYAGFSAGAALAELVPLLADLGRLIAPQIWNCFIDERFRRGDRRRDALVELTNVINTTYELSQVLMHARQVIGKLEGHCVSGIGLLDDEKRHFRSFRNYAYVGGAPDVEPERIPVADSAMSWILEHGRRYESDDLAVQVRFRNDSELRRLGVRRYVGTPLFARGRILGAFFFGSSDPHPFLRIDVWLFENMALQLALAIDNALKHEQVEQLTRRLRQQNVYLREEIHLEHDFREMIGNSPPMRAVRDRIARVAATDSTVLITGETGVGKELVARAIHGGSARAEQPMVKVNCAAIPESMVESELFGHERGAFTSAVERRIGRFELAHEGTLFLDEIGELSPGVQAKLLRVLQDGEFERVGGTKTLKTDCRIIAATNRDLARAVETGRFRSDLYYRLNVFPIEVPSLARRQGDIPELVRSFVQQYEPRMGKRVEQIDEASLAQLCKQAWPGNIRELKHVVERAMILCDGPVLSFDQATMSITAANDAVFPAGAAEDTGAKSGSSASPPAGMATLEAMEADHIRRVLARTGGVIEGPRGAAAVLGLKPSTLRFRMKRLGIQRK